MIVIPHLFKDETTPLSSNEVIQLVLKRKSKKKKQNLSNETNNATIINSITTTLSALPPHKTTR